MPTLIKYLLSIVVHMMWSRMGKGPVPPIRLPRKGPVNLPVVGPWQVMIGMWLMNKLWDRYSRDVKTRLMNAQHPVVRNAGSLIPDLKGAPQNATSPGNTSTQATVAQSTTPATITTPSSPQVQNSPQALPSQSHKTQLLSNGSQAAHPTAGNSNPSQRLSAGSILSSLRRSNSSNQPAQG
jgi:hypothetical protein